MAKDQPSSQPPYLKPKLARLPPNARITKRALQHSSIASPLTGTTTPKCVYVSSHTPFITTIKRVRKFLSAIEARENPHLHQLPKNGRRFQVRGVPSVSEGPVKVSAGKGEEVLVKGTGKAIERVLQVAVHFLGQTDVKVVVRTGSVGTVDDVEVDGEGEEGEEDVPESRVRMLGCLEVGISLR